MLTLDNDEEKKAVVILTRGYTDLKKYDDLIKRNKSISNNLINKSMDIIVFHEGNIQPNHQQYITQFTPELNLIFINVKERNQAFLDKDVVFDKDTISFNMGYRHMCSFWFVDFWNYLDEYDHILRIDEDCIIYFDIDSIFEKMENKIAVYGKWVNDADFVTKNLSNFTLDFLKKNSLRHESCSGPYTNIIGFNLKLLRKNERLKEYINIIKEKNYIYIYRWGDLPLWGQVLHYFYNKNDYLNTTEIKYFHGSHSQLVNLQPNPTLPSRQQQSYNKWKMF